MNLGALVRHPTLGSPKCNKQQRNNRRRGGPAYKRKVSVRTYGQTTNLGVRSSNLFGRANYFKELDGNLALLQVRDFRPGIRWGNKGRLMPSPLMAPFGAFVARGLCRDRAPGSTLAIAIPHPIPRRPGERHSGTNRRRPERCGRARLATIVGVVDALFRLDGPN